jgi:hypothetical protein
MAREFAYSAKVEVGYPHLMLNTELVSVNYFVAKRRANGGKTPVIGKIVNGKFIANNYRGKI